MDDAFRNSSTPTKTQTEEQFAKMFSEMIGDLQTLIVGVGLSVVFSLICVCAVAMAMSMRERTTEVAVLKAIGFGRGLVLTLVLVEAMIVASIGGLIGSIGTKLFFDQFDLGKLAGSFLPFFYVPWRHGALRPGVRGGGGVLQRRDPRVPGVTDVGYPGTSEGGLTTMIPIKYNLRNLRVRWVTTLLTVLGTGAGRGLVVRAVRHGRGACSRA